MNMQVKAIDEKKLWEDFIAAQSPNTFLHSWAWGEFNLALKRKIFRFGIFEGEKLLAVALILKIEARRGTFLFCPHGPIFAEGVVVGDALKSLTASLVELAREERCDFLRFSPLLLDTDENNAIFKDMGYRELPMHMLHPELSWILDVGKGEDVLLQEMRKTTRYCVKRAAKDGIEIEQSSELAGLDKFWEIYKTTAKRHGFVPFSREYLEAEFKVFSQDGNALWLFANYKGKTVAGAMIIFGANSGFYHHGASIHEYAHLNTSHALQWEAIKESKKRGLSFYNFWGVKAKDVSKKHPWYGISLFKRGFGGFEEAYVHGKDLPLTGKYWLSWLVETLRKKKRRF